MGRPVGGAVALSFLGRSRGAVAERALCRGYAFSASGCSGRGSRRGGAGGRAGLRKRGIWQEAGQVGRRRSWRIGATGRSAAAGRTPPCRRQERRRRGQVRCPLRRGHAAACGGARATASSACLVRLLLPQAGQRVRSMPVSRCRRTCQLASVPATTGASVSNCGPVAVSAPSNSSRWRAVSSEVVAWLGANNP